MADLHALASTELFTPCDTSGFEFETTDQIADGREDEIFGQDRAVDAVRFGIGIDAPGYNLFVLGVPGSNRHGVVRRLLETHAQSRPAAADWCYVYNFAEPAKPSAISLPPGLGTQLRSDMQGFAAELGQAIAAAFESEEHRGQIEDIQEEYKDREEQALQELGTNAAARNVAFMRTPRGFVFLPMKDGETLEPKQYADLPEEERTRIDASIDELRERLRKILHEQPRWRRAMQTRLGEVSRETIRLAVGHLIEELKERYTSHPVALGFLDAVLDDVVQMGEALREQANSAESAVLARDSGSVTVRYQINLLVERAANAAAPLEFEDNPTYPNLVGRVDHIAHMGTLVTNFTLIRAGALHRANGGYLLLDADKLLVQPFAWDGLKRALKSGQIRMESLAQAFGWSSALPLEPEPIPLSVKVVLFGQRIHYYLLKAYDPEFKELFKIAADFESEIERSTDNIHRFALMVATLVREQGLKPFDRGSVARLVEHSARLAADAGRLSTRTRDIADLLRESDHCADRAGQSVVTREHVDEALAARIRRADRLRDSVHDAVLRDTVLISTSGVECGQINGLAVMDLGDFMFARPVRISATARIGGGDVIDIERKAELGGATHSKGVMILSAYFASRYSQDRPQSLSATLVFEQSYGPVEGDSASLAELCALLSAPPTRTASCQPTASTTGSRPGWPASRRFEESMARLRRRSPRTMRHTAIGSPSRRPQPKRLGRTRQRLEKHDRDQTYP
ncbi:Lon protease family protein [Rhodocyclaceae bacterium SMB388]